MLPPGLPAHLCYDPFWRCTSAAFENQLPSPWWETARKPDWLLTTPRPGCKSSSLHLEFASASSRTNKGWFSLNACAGSITPQNSQKPWFLPSNGPSNLPHPNRLPPLLLPPISPNHKPSNTVLLTSEFPECWLTAKVNEFFWDYISLFAELVGSSH